DLNRVLDDLRNHPAESIDGYLESRQDDREVGRIGKLLIAAVMGEGCFWGRAHNVSAGAGWIRYITNEICAGAPTWQKCARGNEGVTFVTFNFDHVIEERLSSAIQAHFGVALTSTDIMAALRVLHVHGELPSLPPQPKIATGVVGEIDPAWISFTETA